MSRSIEGILPTYPITASQASKGSVAEWLRRGWRKGTQKTESLDPKKKEESATRPHDTRFLPQVALLPPLSSSPRYINTKRALLHAREMQRGKESGLECSSGISGVWVHSRPQSKILIQ
jgi:hypothetical protein